MAEATSLAAAAFDPVAPVYDTQFGTNPIGLYFRHVVQEKARLAFPRGGRVVDLGCGTGEDAFFLASLGLDVMAVDPSPGMIERARAKAAARNVAGVRFEVLAAEEVGSLGGSFDGVFSNFGALNCAELQRVGTALGSVVRRGARIVCSVIGPRPLPGLLQQALTARPARSAEAPRIGGARVPCRALSFREVREGLGSGFAWRGCAALGVLVPAPAHEDWARRNPMAFGLLAAAEGLVRAWPVARGLGDHLVLEGVRL
jgi:ubiquinone/menaquinone biosynthesis C-methylase UbiE